jgi:hypothetical protein
MIELAVIAVLLLVLDLTFIAIAEHAGSHRSGGPVVLWLVLQAATVFVAGILQGVRRRGWWQAAFVAAVASGVLAFTALVTANTNPGSADCPGTQPCDTSFGLGAVLIGGVAFVALALVALVGRVLGGLATHRRRADL